jgi:YebC/PmpR family DNA-binding regulatory protein
MSGHSKWATTKHKKAAIDAKRGKLFAKLIKNIEVAARTGGGDPLGNPTLYDAIYKAKKSSVPNTTSTARSSAGRAPTAGGADWQTITYEGYAPNGVAVLIECLTDNRNRAAAEVRTALTRNGGKLADPGSVAYVFTARASSSSQGQDKTEDDILEVVLDAGAEEVNDLGRPSRSSPRPVTSSPCARRCRRPGSTTTRPRPRSCRTWRCRSTWTVPSKMIRVVEALEDSDDVQNVFANGDIPTRCSPSSTRSERAGLRVLLHTPRAFAV